MAATPAPHANKVVAALALQADSCPVNGVAAFAVYHDTRKVRRIGGDENVVRLGIGYGAMLNRSRNALGGNQLAVLYADGSLQRNGTLSADGGIGLLGDGLGHGDLHVAMIAALSQGMHTSVHRQGKIFSLGCLENCPCPDGQELGFQVFRNEMLARSEYNLIHVGCLLKIRNRYGPCRYVVS